MNNLIYALQENRCRVGGFAIIAGFPIVTVVAMVTLERWLRKDDLILKIPETLRKPTELTTESTTELTTESITEQQLN